MNCIATDVSNHHIKRSVDKHLDIAVEPMQNQICYSDRVSFDYKKQHCMEQKRGAWGSKMKKAE